MDLLHPFRRPETEVERDQAEVEAQGQAERPSESAAGNSANDATPTESGATAPEPKPTVESQAIVGPLSKIGPSELLDRLETAKTGKAKIEAGRAFVKANPDAISERMVEVLGTKPRDRRGAGKLRAVGYWPSGTVAKATAILQASPRGGA